MTSENTCFGLLRYKLHLAQARNDARAQSLSCQIQCTQDGTSESILYKQGRGDSIKAGVNM